MEQQRPENEAVYLSAKDAAAKLNVSLATLYTYVSRKKVRAVRTGGRTSRYLNADIERVLAESGRSVAPAPLTFPAISVMTSEDIIYRGSSALSLARHASVEETACLLWETTDKLFDEPPMPPPRKWEILLEAVESYAPHDRLAMLLPALEAADLYAFDPSPAGLRRSSANILRWAAAIVAGLPSPPDGPIHDWIASGMISGEGLSDMFRRVLVLSADRGIDAMVHAVRAAASTGATPYRCVMSGLATATGSQLPSARSSAFSRFIHEIEASPDPTEPVMARVRENDVLPGFSYTPDGFAGPDPRAAALWAFLHEALPENPQFEKMDRAFSLAIRLTGHQPEFSFLAACVARLAGADPALNLVRLGRITGWLGHVIEQRSDQTVRFET